MKAKYTYEKTKAISKCCHATILFRHKIYVDRKITCHELKLICSKCRKQQPLSKEQSKKIREYTLNKLREQCTLEDVKATQIYKMIGY